MYKLPEVRGRAVASLSSMNRLYSGNKSSIIQSTEEGKTITQARQLQSGEHDHNFEFAQASVFHDSNEYRQAKKAKSFFEEGPKKWYHCRNSCMFHVQPLAVTAYVFADTSWQNWYCSDTFTVGDKDYPFLLYCFTNSTTVLVTTGLEIEVHFTHSVMN